MAWRAMAGQDRGIKKPSLFNPRTLFRVPAAGRAGSGSLPARRYRNSRRLL